MLPNLQLLEGPYNIAKSAQPPGSWSATEFPDPTKLANYLDRNSLPEELPNSATEFKAFFQARRALLVELVKKTVATS